MEPLPKIQRKNLYSFINGRSTSISYNSRPRPDKATNLDHILAEETEDEIMTDSIENSAGSCISSKSSEICSSTLPDTSLVFLRIRPTFTINNQWKYKIQDNTFIIANTDSLTTNNKDTLEKHYSFSDIFNSDISQSEVYERTVQPLITFDENSTVMVYGTSGSGKTFTLLGDSSNPGLAPRALQQIFTENSNNISVLPYIKYSNGTVTVLSDDQITNETALRKSLIKNIDNKDFTRMTEIIKHENNFQENFIPNTDLFIWISFAEIYNEFVYDLLDPNYCNIQRQNNKENMKTSTAKSHLQIMSNNGDPYIKDITTVCVRKAEEAFKILRLGLDRVSTASTLINNKSTRSHCIFIVDILKYSSDNKFSTVSHKFCDLAGSERLKKTENSGTRLREAKNINKSLMTLGRCLTSSYTRQNVNETNIIPYRDSKLTTLLQNPLTGNERISLIVNICPLIDYVEENLNCLNFSSIAQKIVIKPILHKKKTKGNRYSVFLNQASLSMNNAATVQQLEEENEYLRNELARLKFEISQQEIDIKRSLVTTFTADHKKLEQMYKTQIADTQKRHEKEFERLRSIIRQKIHNIGNLNDYVLELESKIERLQRKNDVIIIDDEHNSTSSDSDTNEVDKTGETEDDETEDDEIKDDKTKDDEPKDDEDENDEDEDDDDNSAEQLNKSNIEDNNLKIEF